MNLSILRSKTSLNAQAVILITATWKPCIIWGLPSNHQFDLVWSKKPDTSSRSENWLHFGINKVKVGLGTLKIIRHKRGIRYYRVRGIRSILNKTVGTVDRYQQVFEINHIRETNILLYVDEKFMHSKNSMKKFRQSTIITIIQLSLSFTVIVRIIQL